MKNLKLYTYGTLLFAAGLAFYLVNSIKYSIDEEARINAAENKVIEKLKMIRDAQIAFQSVNGKYANEWDSLLNFVENGNIFLIQRREETVLLDYGAEETTLYLDTLGSVTVIDSLFSSIPNFVASNLIYVPGYDDVKFEIWASKIEKVGVEVDVVGLVSASTRTRTRAVNISTIIHSTTTTSPSIRGRRRGGGARARF